MKVTLSGRHELNDKYPFDEEYWFYILVNGDTIVKTKDKSEAIIAQDKVCAFIEKYGTIPAPKQIISELKNVKRK